MYDSEEHPHWQLAQRGSLAHTLAVRCEHTELICGLCWCVQIKTYEHKLSVCVYASMLCIIGACLDFSG